MLAWASFRKQVPQERPLVVPNLQLFDTTGPTTPCLHLPLPHRCSGRRPDGAPAGPVPGRQGHQVQVFDAHGPSADGAAAPVAAAMLAPLAESAVTEPNVVRMGQYSLERWPQLLASLSSPVYFQRNGTLVVWHRQDQADAQRLAALFQKNCQLNTTLPQPEHLNAQRLAEVEPALQGRFHSGILLPDEGQLDNRQLLPALLKELEALDVQLHWHSPRELSDFAPGENRESGQPDLVLDCRGLGARTAWPQLRGVRGEVVRVHAPEVRAAPHAPGAPALFAVHRPKENHLFVIGATEIESDDMGPASLRSTMELLSALHRAQRLCRGAHSELNTQCRPTLPDNLPALRWVGERVLQVNACTVTAT